MNDLLDQALRSLKAIKSAHDIRYLREYVRDKQGLPAKLNGIEGGFQHYARSEALKVARKAADALNGDDLASFSIAVELLDDALQPKPGGGRGHVQIKTIKRSYPQVEYEDGVAWPVTDQNGQQVYQDIFYRYAYVRQWANSGDADRKRRRLLNKYADQGMGKGSGGGCVAAALDQKLVTEGDVLDAFHAGKDTYRQFKRHCSELLMAEGVGGQAGTSEQAPALRKGTKAGPKTRSVDADYQIKIVLLDVEPVVWRRFRVPGDVSFRELHEIVYRVMGWEGYHPYQFLVDDHAFKDNPQANEDLPSERVIARYLTAEQPFGYEYDFIALWGHELLVEKILPPSGGAPVCLAGKHACPPEDCGGSENFMAYLEAKKRGPVPGWLNEQIGPGFDPEGFSQVKVNANLKTYWLRHEAS